MAGEELRTVVVCTRMLLVASMLSLFRSSLFRSPWRVENWNLESGIYQGTTERERATMTS